MKTVSAPLAASLAVVSLLAGLAGGYYISPSYQQTMYEKSEMGLGNADRFLDLRYINKMAAHHRGAILLADQIAEKTQRQELKQLATSIQQDEPKLIAELYGWKKQWYDDSRQATDPAVANLGPADEKTDLRFLNALIAHHDAGIEMTKEARTKSSRAEVLNNADAVENFLTTTLVSLMDLREQWYGVK